jgi:hypothetical protein
MILAELFFQLLNGLELRELRGELDTVEFERPVLHVGVPGAGAADEEERLLPQREHGHDGCDATENKVGDDELPLHKERGLNVGTAMAAAYSPYSRGAITHNKCLAGACTVDGDVERGSPPTASAGPCRRCKWCSNRR